MVVEIWEGNEKKCGYEGEMSVGIIALIPSDVMDVCVVTLKLQEWNICIFGSRTR